MTDTEIIEVVAAHAAGKKIEYSWGHCVTWFTFCKSHGQAPNGVNRSRTYLVWQSMVGRCYRKKDSSYRYYGAKGVTVSDRWRKFENFLQDMGDAPAGAHIHRIKNAKIYSKETCEWMSGSEHIALHNRERRKAA